MMNLKENLSIAKEIAREAGDFLLDNKNKTKQIFSEEGRDIKLEIDRATETRIKKSLKDTGIPVLGEEFGGNSTFPQVLLNNKKLGGCTDTVKYLKEHNLLNGSRRHTS